MSHAMITVAVPIADTASILDLRQAVDRLGNPASPEVRQAFEATGKVHFASIDVVPGDAGEPGYLVVEMSGDGADGPLLDAVAEHAGQHLRPVLELALDRPLARVGGVLHKYKLTVSPNLMHTTGICFCGTPGIALARIREEAGLERHLRGVIANMPREPQALTMLNNARAVIAADPQFAWAMERQKTPHLQPVPSVSSAITGLLFRSGLTPYLFGGLFALLAFFYWRVSIPFEKTEVGGTTLVDCMNGLGGASTWSYTSCTLSRAWTYLLTQPLDAISLFVGYLVWSLILLTIILAGILLLLYLALRRLERADKPRDLDPDPDVVEAIMRRENQMAQNHMFAVSTIKPGRLRSALLPLVFWVIGQLAARAWRPGFLGTLGTIHFARWVKLPKTNKLLFLSNFGGSWESYLEDFITKAHQGLTAVWSNTHDFPATKNLIQNGATDGERFKRWARNQQMPTLFWYSAYPDLTTDVIRNNAAIRHGLSGASTESEAEAWLAMFGSVPRPARLIETDEIQTIAFGGMTQLPSSMAVGVRLPTRAPERARAWLDAVRERVSFGDRLSEDAVVVLSLTAPGLAKLGLHADVVRTFPAAFIHGMGAPWRARVLGDLDDSAPAAWSWGGDGTGIDAMLFLYARNPARLDEIWREELTTMNRHGAAPVKEIRTNIVLRDGHRIEPFGFVDGISNPIMRGTRRFHQGAPATDTVEPGEFVLGYPDGRGFFPPTPQVSARRDRHDDLPVVPADLPSRWPEFAGTARAAPRDLGANGSYLVVRQLEQDVPAFERYVEKAAAEMTRHHGKGAGITPEWVGAKMVGRWKNGTSLVRYPHVPGSGAPDNEFWYGVDDPQGTRCPFGSHARRAHPRDSLEPGSQKQFDISNRHRLLRVGRRYEAEHNGEALPGLLFMCLNADIERQFEFVQQTWIGARSFHGLTNETDPLIGTRNLGSDFTVPMTEAAYVCQGLPRFVRCLGGAYLFVPSRRALRFLSRAL